MTYVYDSTSEHRGLLVSLTDSQAGTFAGSYDAAGALVSQTYPSGLASTRHYDDAGQPTSLTYVMGASTWLTFTAAHNGFGQIVAQSSNGSSQAFAYDSAGRLTSVADTDQTINPVARTTRQYAYDLDSNRQSLTSYPADQTGACSTSTTPTVTSHSYDEADRIAVSGGYVYDALGRTATVPAADAGGTTLSLSYYASDMVAGQSQGTASRGFTVDPNGRISSISGTNFVTQTYRFDGGSDSPAWISGADASWSRNVLGIDGSLAAIVTSASSDELQLVNLHGDVAATAPNTTGAMGTDAYFESTEFGAPRTSNLVSPRYGWLGAHRRDSSDGLAGVVLMGERLYLPATGRFLQRDPMAGGSANDYDYANQDPVNEFDLNGQFAIAAAAPAAFFCVECDAVVGILVVGIGVSFILTFGPSWAIHGIWNWATQRGGSGDWRRHFDRSKSRKQAQDKAASAGAGKPIEHSNPRVGDPHFHPTDRKGNKIPGPHYGYPRRFGGRY